MDQRTQYAYTLMAAMVLTVILFLAFWKGSGLDRTKMAGWRRVRRWWRRRG